mmetsp:Transcript_18530/g.31151  ORF Transcript_18530/g.31151 Transcript_18530/m.31151 type:complete len:103 (-) Transcript_18530:1016-1324(-)
MYGWLTASLTAILVEAIAVAKDEEKAKKEKKEEGSSSWITSTRFNHALAMTNNCTQALVACSLLGLIPMKPRTTASLGLLTSCISMYSMAPALAPPPQKATK